MKAILILCFVFFCSFWSFGQSKMIDKVAPKTFRFRSINMAGIIKGEKSSYIQLQTINGVAFNKWFAGVGIGLDYYTYRTIPLFLDVRRTITHKKNAAFLYADGGNNFPWVHTSTDTWYKSNFSNGWYYDMGVGYTIHTGKSSGLLLSAGYTMKTINENQYYSMVMNPYPYTSDGSTSRLQYEFRRISIKAGWQF